MTMTGQEVAEAEVTRVRRIFVVALAAALVATAVAYALELVNSDEQPGGPAVSSLPLTFRQPGFVERPVRRVTAVELPAALRRGTVRLPGGNSPIYVVARCDTGHVRVTLGALSTAQLCRGTATGVVVLNLVRRPAPLVVTVSGAQKVRWAVGIYR